MMSHYDIPKDFCLDMGDPVPSSNCISQYLFKMAGDKSVKGYNLYGARFTFYEYIERYSDCFPSISSSLWKKSAFTGFYALWVWFYCLYVGYGNVVYFSSSHILLAEKTKNCQFCYAFILTIYFIWSWYVHHRMAFERVSSLCKINSFIFFYYSSPEAVHALS